MTPAGHDGDGDERQTVRARRDGEAADETRQPVLPAAGRDQDEHDEEEKQPFGVGNRKVEGAGGRQDQANGARRFLG